MSMQKTWVILGASSPIARAFAKIAASEKSDLILVGRDQEDLEANAADYRTRYHVKVSTIATDLADTQKHEEVLAQCQALAPLGFNILVAFAIMPPQGKINAEPALAEKVLHVNAVAPIHFMQSYLPVLKAQDSGHIIVIGSVAGDRGFQRNPMYAASKACLNTYTAGLRCTLGQDSKVVTLVKPGFIDTRMTFYSRDVPFSATPEQCAFACWQAAKYKKTTIYFPWFWRLLMCLFQWIPESILRRVKVD